MTRRKFIQIFAGSLITLLSVLSSSYAYAYYIEPRHLLHDQRKIISKKIPTSFNNFKIIQFSDTHLGFHYSLKQFQSLIERINRENPDIVVFTGDLIDRPQTYDNHAKLTQLLQNIQAPMGKFWVYGNHDHGGYGTHKINEMMIAADFTLLKNEHRILTKENDQLVIAGIDDAILGKPNLNKTLKDVHQDDYTVLLAHEPDLADLAAKYSVDLQLSGHSHGGQIRFPLVGHLYTPPYAKKYVRGAYKLNDDQMTLFVSSGIGTTRLPLRLLCKPEFHTFTLKSNNV